MIYIIYFKQTDDGHKYNSLLLLLLLPQVARVCVKDFTMNVISSITKFLG